MLEVPIDRSAATKSELRRSVPRQPVDWNAKYRLHDGPAERWRACRVADISPAGSGLRLFGISADEAEGRAIDVLVELTGEVRNIVPSMKQDVRVGIEFVDLSGDAAQFVQSMRHSRVRW